MQKTVPTAWHGIIERLLSFVFTLYLHQHPVGDTGAEIRCIFGPTGRQRGPVPDFVFVAAARLPGSWGNEPFRGAPDLAVEILSPDDRMVRVMEQVRFSLENGVRFVWLIDPTRRTVEVLSTPGVSHILTEDDTRDGGDVLPGFSTPVHEILPPLDSVTR